MVLSRNVWAAAGQSAEDVPLGHLQPHSDRGDPGDGCRETGDVCLHVTQQLLELFKNWKNAKIKIKISPTKKILMKATVGDRNSNEMLPLFKHKNCSVPPDVHQLVYIVTRYNYQLH